MNDQRRRELEQLYLSSPSTFISKRYLLKNMLGYTDEEINEVMRELTVNTSQQPVKIPKF